MKSPAILAAALCLLGATGCGEPAPTSAATSMDGPQTELGPTAVDLGDSPRDLVVPDLRAAMDLTASPDLEPGTTMDLAPPADLAVSPDLVVSCVNRLRDGDETDIDCGGSCGACAEGLTCKLNRDCQKGSCANGVCGPGAWSLVGSFTAAAVSGAAGGFELRAVVGWHVLARGQANGLALEGWLR